MPQFVNLNEKGFTDAASNLGDPNILDYNLKQIETGELLDISFKDENTDSLRGLEINKLQNNLNSMVSEFSTIENDLHSKVSYKNLILTKLQKLKLDPNDPEVIPEGGMFSWPKFISLVIIFIGLTAFLFYYYSGIPWLAFKDCEPPSKMFPSLFDLFNYILPSPFILIAFVFFSFGIGLHFAIDNIKNRFAKITIIASIIIITFSLDIFLSIRIHNCHDFLLFDRIGQNLPPWFRSNIVFILFLLGFVTFFLWSFLYHNILKELGKKNILTNLQNSLANSEDEIKSIQDKKSDLERKINILNSRLQNLKDLNIPVVITEQIKQSKLIYISSFMTIFNGPIPNGESRKRESENIINNFNIL